MRMKWEQLLATKRNREVSNNIKRNQSDLRSAFEKDYHRIIGSASFRRLQDKTQVFPLDQSDFIRTRLTHSLEVSSFGKSLGQNIGESIMKYKRDPGFTIQMKEDICNIVQCAGLIHDIGNPPFGHFGEAAIREWFERNLPELTWNNRPVSEALNQQMYQDLCQFEGNAQALRLVTKLHFLVDEQGMNLTYGLLNTIIKYPVSSVGINPKSGNIKEKKMGYYLADEDIFNEIQQETGTNGRRHPLTFILEASDDIAYKTADIEDAYVKGYLSYYDLQKELEGLGDDQGDSYFRPLEKLEGLYQNGVKKQVKNPEEYAIKNWIVSAQGFLISCATFGFTSHYDEIMEGTYGKDLFAGTFGEKLMDKLGDIAVRYVFTSREIYRLEAAEANMIDFLMDRMVRAAVKYDTSDRLTSMDKRMISMISDNYINAYHYHGQGKDEVERLYLRLLLVTDYICGMTDSYAKRLYQELNAII